jgi:hypothetical protein
MRRIILLTSLLFGLVVLVMHSCTKSKLKGCNSGKKQFTCTVNESDFRADSMGCSYDSSNHIIYLFARDTLNGAQLLFNLHYNLQNLDINLKSVDSVYSGKAIGVWNGVVFKSLFGNFGMEINDNNTVCGQFFFSDNNPDTKVSIGKYSEVPLYYIP